MPDLPWFPFDADAWLSNVKLRLCSRQARSVWVDMLCMMHKNEPRGSLTVGGKPLTLEEVAVLLPGNPAENVSLINELLARDVASTVENGAIASRRMLADEGLRQIRAAAGRQGGRPATPVSDPLLRPPESKTKANTKANVKQTPKQNESKVQSKPITSDGGEGGASLSLSFSNSESLSELEGGVGGTKADPETVEEIYRAFPKVGGGMRAKRAIVEALTKISASDLLACVKRYAAAMQSQLVDGESARWVKQAESWLREECWLSYPPPKRVGLSDERLRELFRRGVDGINDVGRP